MAPDSSTIRIEGPAPSVSAAALSALGKETFVETFGELYRAADLKHFLNEKHGVKAYAAILNDPLCGVWTAIYQDSDPVGYLAAGPCSLPVDDMPPNAGELMRFYIRREFQGGGVGGRMLEAALTWLHQRFDHIFLSVYSENLKAQRLYERWGFKKIQRYDFMVGDHADPEFIMKRMIGNG